MKTQTKTTLNKKVRIEKPTSKGAVVKTKSTVGNIQSGIKRKVEAAAKEKVKQKALELLGDFAKWDVERTTITPKKRVATMQNPFFAFWNLAFSFFLNFWFFGFGVGRENQNAETKEERRYKMAQHQSLKEAVQRAEVTKDLNAQTFILERIAAFEEYAQNENLDPAPAKDVKKRFEVFLEVVGGEIK